MYVEITNEHGAKLNKRVSVKTVQDRWRPSAVGNDQGYFFVDFERICKRIEFCWLDGLEFL